MMSDQGNTSAGENTDDEWAAALVEQAESEENTQVLPKAEFDEFSADTVPPGDETANLNIILDIPVHISMEVGRTHISIRNLLQLNQGSIVELDRLAGEPLDVLVNGTLVAHGEVVVVNEKYGIRLTDVISAAERVTKLT